MIPKKIFQTFESKDMPFGMSKACESWKQKNPDYEYTFFDKTDRVNFIRNNFNKEVLNAYYTLIPGAFKADLWRVCVLYIYGGVYIDSDTICETPLSELIEADDKFIITRDDPMAKKWLANAFIASIPNHPILKEVIARIVRNCKSKQEMFYLDYSGPACMGKSVNFILGNNIEDEYKLGKNNGLKIMKHDFGRTKFTYGNKDILHVEYPGKLTEMDGIGNKKFWDYVQAKTIYTQIPRKIIYTTYDILDVNEYMVDSFRNKNPDWEMLYFNQKAVDEWFKNSIYDKAYKKLTQRGEKTDFFRYCYLYENGGVYTDADTYCNNSLDNFIEHQDLIVGLEACLPLDDTFFNNIGIKTDKHTISVANWFIATAPKHPAISVLINDIIDNPKEGVLQNTGPGRFTKHILNYFGDNHDFTNDIQVGNSQIKSINRFGSNQSHSNAIKVNNPFNNDNPAIYITHMFDGKWRDNTPKQDIIKYKTEHCSHNLSLIKTLDGYRGIAREDIDTSRTEFMGKLGDCRTLYEFNFNADLTLKNHNSRTIQYDEVAKFEDYRSFSYKNKVYHLASYIDKNWNTTVCILDRDYNVIKHLKFEDENIVGFGVGKPVKWEKNWLPFIHNNELHIIYNTSPSYIVYKHIGDWEFEKIIDVENHLQHKFPQNELYFTAKCKVGGSTAPIWIEEEDCYVYLVHTKIYNERAYNHYAVKLDKNLNIINIGYKPFISKSVPYALFFITTMILEGNYVLLSGGLEDNTNWNWRVATSSIMKTFI